jgi:hypothetical protein
MYNFNSSPAIRNSIVWGNKVGTADSAVFNIGSSTPVFSCSIVQGSGGSGGSWVTAFGGDGGGNKDADPKFVVWIDPSGGGWIATTGGDYRLQAGSPTINTGRNDLYPANADAIDSSLSAGVKEILNDALPYDLGGNVRKNGVIDMGAYEKQ